MTDHIDFTINVGPVPVFPSAMAGQPGRLSLDITARRATTERGGRSSTYAVPRESGRIYVDMSNDVERTLGLEFDNAPEISERGAPNQGAWDRFNKQHVAAQEMFVTHVMRHLATAQPITVKPRAVCSNCGFIARKGDVECPRCDTFTGWHDEDADSFTKYVRRLRNEYTLDAVAGTRHSRKAGCSCGCSPGWVVDKDTTRWVALMLNCMYMKLKASGYDLHIDVRFADEPSEKQRAALAQEERRLAELVAQTDNVDVLNTR